jgi:hypothetical protein
MSNARRTLWAAANTNSRATASAAAGFSAVVPAGAQPRRRTCRLREQLPGVVAVLVEQVEGDPVSCQKRDGGGVDVDGRERDKVANVGHRDVDAGAVCPLDDKA